MNAADIFFSTPYNSAIFLIDLVSSTNFNFLVGLSKHMLMFVLAISKNKLQLKYRVTFLSKHACSAEVAGTKTNTILGGKFMTQTNGTNATRTLDNPHTDNQASFGLAFLIVLS